MTVAIVILALLCAVLIAALAWAVLHFKADVGYRRAYGLVVDANRDSEDRIRRLAAQLDDLRHELDGEGLRDALGQRVVIQTKDNQSIEGVLDRVHSDSYRLSSAKYLSGGGTRQVGGEVLVLRTNFSWAQVLPEREGS